jgi:hypothetical protein
LKKEDGTEVNVENLPAKTVIRVESENQRRKRLAEEQAKEKESATPPQHPGTPTIPYTLASDNPDHAPLPPPAPSQAPDSIGGLKYRLTSSPTLIPGMPNIRPPSIRMESEEQRKKRLEEEDIKRMESARIEAYKKTSEWRKRKEAERKVKEAEERKRQEEEEEKEKERIHKEEEAQGFTLKEKLPLCKEIEEREAQRVREEE